MLTTELEEIEGKKPSPASDEKIHPWRLYPIGKHFVKKHIVHMPPSAEHPNGQIIERHEHCAVNPSANICCGVRWLFRKKITASSKLDRQATWIEAVADYKGILKNLPHKWMEIFQHHYLCMTEGC